MALSRRKELFKIITFDIQAQTISGYGTYTKIIDLESEHWTVALITLWNKFFASQSKYTRRASAFITATKDIVDGYGQGVEYNLVGVQGYTMTYYVPSYLYSGYSYATDTQLTPATFDGTGQRAAVKSAVIIGSELHITFKNINVGSIVMYVTGNIRVESLIQL